MKESDIVKRWNERIVRNGWDKEGKSGASAYLEKYGRNIGDEKLQALADYARKMGCVEFAAFLEGTKGMSKPKLKSREIS